MKDLRPPIEQGKNGLANLFSWLVTVRFTVEDLNPEGEEHNDYLLTLHHECTHFWHAITTSFVYQFSHDLLKAAIKVRNHIVSLKSEEKIKIPKDLINTWTDLNARLYEEYDGVTNLDIIESAAVYVSYCSGLPELSHESYRQILAKDWSGQAYSCYRKAYEKGARVVGEKIFNVFSALCFISLCYDSPAKVFSKLLEFIKDNPDFLEPLSPASFRDLIHVFATTVYHQPPKTTLELITDENGEIRTGGKIPSTIAHPVLYLYAVECVKMGNEGFDPNYFGAYPHQYIAGFGSMAHQGKFIERILPPLVVHGEGKAVALDPKTPFSDLGDHSASQAHAAITALVGAMMVLCFPEGGYYMACHQTDCPWHKTKLCFSNPLIPVSKSWEACFFLQILETNIGIALKKNNFIESWLNRRKLVAKPLKPKIMEKEFKVINVENEFLEKCDTAKLVSLFFKEMTIGGAKKLGNQIVLSFSKYDNDKRPNCTIPEIRNFVKKLHSEDSRFPYYYVDNQLFGMHLFHIGCLVPLSNIHLLGGGEKFGLSIQDPKVIEDYLIKIDAYMQQLGFSASEINERIRAVGLSLGINF